jgi:uncharacterized protein YbaR (Trm112 family)
MPVTLPNQGTSLECPLCHHSLVKTWDPIAQRYVYKHQGDRIKGEIFCPNEGHTWYINGGTTTQLS